MKLILPLIVLVALCDGRVTADEPLTYVQGAKVRWNQVCLTVPNRFQSIGAFDFTLPESAGTRTVFAEKSGDNVMAMVVVQAEHMTTSADKYDYALRPGILVAGVPMKINAFAASDTLSARRSPNAETDLTMHFLQTKSLRAPDQWLKVRYATYDAGGRNEFLVFYMEPLDLNSLDLAAVGPSDLEGFSAAFAAARDRAAKSLQFSPCTP
jgi:hypothetical protein